MDQILYEEVPSLDLADFLDGNEVQKARFVEELGQAFNNIGFVAIRSHYLSYELQDKLYSIIRKFFALPEEVKQKYEDPELAGQRGYVGKGKEHAKGRSAGDLKEFFHIGQDVEEDDLFKKEYPANIWPDEVPELREYGLKTYKQLERTGIEILRAIAIYLDLEPDYFDQKVNNGNSILRPIHYYPIKNPEEVPEDAVRAAEHGDINLITLLMGASAEGLQVLRRDGEWISITAMPDQLVVNVGDMLERLTNKKLKSTIHRVINPPKEYMTTSRFSIPFFMHPRSKMDLSCLKSCIDEEHPKQFEDITAGAFLNQRLSEIGLKK